MTFPQPFSVLYVCSTPKKWGVRASVDQKLAGHFIAQINDEYIVWPENMSFETINPKGIETLLKVLPHGGLLLLDRVCGVEGFVSIVGHVNRSGNNMLIGNTPYDDRPQFPDMSDIYDPIPDYPHVAVHTLGPERFQAPPQEHNIVWSEAVGLVAPVFHYLGYQLSALGGNPTQASLTAEIPGFLPST